MRRNNESMSESEACREEQRAALRTDSISVCVEHVQVGTGDGWAPYIARPLVGNTLHRRAASVSTSSDADTAAVAASAAVPGMERGVAVYFIVFFFAAGICLLGVVHAILLDEFMLSMQVTLNETKRVHQGR